MRCLSILLVFVHLSAPAVETKESNSSVKKTPKEILEDALSPEEKHLHQAFYFAKNADLETRCLYEIFALAGLDFDHSIFNIEEWYPNNPTRKTPQEEIQISNVEHIKKEFIEKLKSHR